MTLFSCFSPPFLQPPKNYSYVSYPGSISNFNCAHSNQCTHRTVVLFLRSPLPSPQLLLPQEHSTTHTHTHNRCIYIYIYIYIYLYDEDHNDAIPQQRFTFFLFFSSSSSSPLLLCLCLLFLCLFSPSCLAQQNYSFGGFDRIIIIIIVHIRWWVIIIICVIVVVVGFIFLVLVLMGPWNKVGDPFWW